MTKKKIMIAVVALLAIGVTAYGVMKPAKADTMLIHQNPYEEYVVEEGVVNAINAYKIYSPLSGKVASVGTEEGAFVKKGDLIFEMETEDLQTQLNNLALEKESISGLQESAQPEVTSDTVGVQRNFVEIAQRNMNAAKKEMERYGALLESGAVSQNVFEDMETSYENARSTYDLERLRLEDLVRKIGLDEGTKKYYISKLEAIDNQIKAISEDIEDAVVLAPADGFMGSFDVDAGDWLSENQAVSRVLSDTALEVETYVLARNTRDISTGDQVEMEIETNYDYETLEGTITYIGKNAVDVQSPLGITEKRIRVVIKPEQPEKLIIGEKIDVIFMMYENEAAFNVSRDYIFNMDGKLAVWSLSGGVAKLFYLDPLYETTASVVVDPEGNEALEVIIPPYPEKMKEGMKLQTSN